MGKSERNQANDIVNSNLTRATDQGSQMWGYLQGQLPGVTQQAQQTYGQASGAYGGMLGGMGAYDPGAYNQLSGQINQNIQTGGYNDPGQLSQLKSDIGGNVQTGGYDQSSVDRLNKQYSDLTAGGLGGIDQGQAGIIRGGYQNLANTGGISDDTAGAMRRQAAGAAQGVYSTMGQNLSRQQAASGFGGGGGETAQMARQASQAAATATTGANAQIGQLRQQGTIAGLGGLSGFEQGAAAGQRAAVAGSQGLAQSQAAGRLQGTQQEAGLAQSQQQGTLASTQASQELATGAAQQRIAAAGGLANLYSSSPGYVTSLVNQIMQQQQVTGTLTSQQASIMAELSKEPGLFQNIMQGISTVGGALGGALTGLGGLGMMGGGLGPSGYVSKTSFL